MLPYREPGGSWRPFWLTAGVLAVLGLLDVLLPVPGLPSPVWALAGIAVLGVVAAGCLSARRIWTVRVDADDLAVGRERVPLREVDVGHLRAPDAGVDAGAPVLGGGWSVPRGRTGFPLRLADGRTVLVPTRDPESLAGALLAAVPDTPGRGSGTEGTLGS